MGEPLSLPTAWWYALVSIVATASRGARRISTVAPRARSFTLIVAATAAGTTAMRDASLTPNVTSRTASDETPFGRSVLSSVDVALTPTSQTSTSEVVRIASRE